MLAILEPGVAISCMPTQMPRKGLPLSAITASSSASTMPGMRIEAAPQSAKAPTPGSTMRSALPPPRRGSAVT